MTPEQISIITSVATIVDKMGSWPFGAILAFATLGPWLILFFVARGQERRFEAVRQMYENNVKLVEGFEKLSNEQQDLIILNTQAMTEVKNLIKHFIEYHREGRR